MTLVRHALAAASLTLVSLLAAAPLSAQTHGTMTLQSGPQVYAQNRPGYLPAPPPPRYEAVPRARRGQVWVAGHWEWQGRRHVWKSGYWLKARPGYAYSAPRWEQRGGRWVMQEGRWDRNGNGVPDRYERPRDRDHDGVPNRYDRNPNNPYRN